MYFVVLDYTNNRIGFALQRTKFVDALFDAVTLIRFVVWAFLLGIFYTHCRDLCHYCAHSGAEMLYEFY